jgi:hypothetical protein
MGRGSQHTCIAGLQEARSITLGGEGDRGAKAIGNVGTLRSAHQKRKGTNILVRCM